MLQLFNGSSEIAVRDDGKDFAYSQLRSTVNRMRHFLQICGSKRIAILMEQGFFNYCLEWACYLEGVVFCCYDYDAPIDRILYCNKTYSPDLVVSDKDWEGIATINVSATIGEESTVNHHDISPEEIAYVMFTSGSTGVPKGVMIKRKALDNVVRWAKQHYSLSSSTVYAQYSKNSFDLSVLDIFLGLSIGVKLIPFKGIAKLLPGKLIRESCITHWHSVPSAFRALQNRRELTPETLSSFKTVVFCGETLYVDLAKEILKCNPNIALWNTYGPTEATVFCSALHVTEEKINSFKGPSVSIGQPIDTMYFSLGANTSEGELVLVGENVAKGYINDSDRNKFDSFSVNGKNYPSYRSGDYVRVSGGEYFFICRIDNQVKIRGNRFDMDEITYALQKIGCHGVVSIEQEGEIFTFVCSQNSDCPMSESEMQEYLRDKLPTYGVPYRIMLVDSFPLNTNGKIDKRELTRFIEGGV